MEERAGGVEELEPLLLHGSKDDIIHRSKDDIIHRSKDNIIHGSKDDIIHVFKLRQHYTLGCSIPKTWTEFG